MNFRIGQIKNFCLLWVFACSAAWAQLPEGPGQDITLKLCGNCHDAKVVTQQRQGKQGWTDTISKMIEKGAEGTEEQFNAVLDYLVKNFGPVPAPVNINKAPASELESQLEVTSKEAAAIVTYRDEKGAFKAIDDLKNIPGLDFKKIEAKKDRIVL
jgi:competence protein ComEA